jgi:plastocyanin
MRRTRRNLLRTTGAALVVGSLAGCNTSDTEAESTETDVETEGGGGSSGGSTGEETEEPTETATAPAVSAETAVAAEWNAMRARLFDAVALGTAGAFADGASVARDVFARFEESSGEWGAHEQLEATNEQVYESFESNLGELREALGSESLDDARDAASDADQQLQSAIRGRTDPTTAAAFDLQLLGTRVENAAVVAPVDTGAAATVAERALDTFEESEVHDLVEEADAESYETFENAAEAVVGAAGSDDIETVQEEADAALSASVAGSYAVVGAPAVAGTGHLATYQAEAFDAAALSGLGGPSTDFAHAAALTLYRARVDDAGLLYAAGAAEAAKSAAQSVFQHFEGARAHEALEEASEEAYTGFEDDGLSALVEAIDAGDDAGVESAISTVHESLVTGVTALGSGPEPAVLEAGYFRSRLGDARELLEAGNVAGAKAVAQGLFQTFEANEADFHETLEETSAELYETFEEEHLVGAIDALDGGDEQAAEAHLVGAMDALLQFETEAGSVAHVSGAEAGYMAARGFDASGLAALGRTERAAAVVEATFAGFEAGLGGFHEALEEADEGLYETFESKLGAIRSAASSGGDVTAAAQAFNAEAVAAMYAIVGAAGGSFGDMAGTLAQDVFADFEEARVHELLEEADEGAYETFEARLGTFIESLSTEALSAFAAATLRAQFAVAGALDKAPVEAETGDSGESGGDADLQGGPNVVEGVPEDADHVVKMQAVAFEPKELTVTVGDTVAFEHAAGEAHNVVAYEDEIPEDATYWASGGFDSQEAAEAGWDEGEGAVQSGQSYVHTFETTGSHGYYCVPHEAAGMVGTVVVEE